MNKNSNFDLDINCSRKFASWLETQNVSIAFSTYQYGKVFFVGLKRDQRAVSISERTFERCMGLHVKHDGLYLASLYQIWKFTNILNDSNDYYQDQYDALFVPSFSYWTTVKQLRRVVRTQWIRKATCRIA